MGFCDRVRGRERGLARIPRLLHADFSARTPSIERRKPLETRRLVRADVLRRTTCRFVIALLAGCAWFGRSARSDASPFARSAMLCIAGAYAVYVVRIGGDMLYHRYAAFPVGLGLCATSGVCEAAFARMSNLSARAPRAARRARDRAGIRCRVIRDNCASHRSRPRCATAAGTASPTPAGTGAAPT